ncbi:hypothetical protein ACYQR9_21770 [Methylobacterium sp. CM6241]
MDRDNRKRALAEVVSLEAWHKGFTKNRKSADLFVDVAFFSGRIGKEASADVRFELCLKRAHLVVIIPPTEPAKVSPASVRRDTPLKKIKSSETVKSSSKQSTGIGGILKGGLKGILPQIELKGSADYSSSRQRVTEIVQNNEAFKVLNVRIVDNEYVWIIKPVEENFLEGRPWNAVKEPRLNITDTRSDRSKGIEPNIRIEVRCLREDIDIKSIQYKK